MAHSKAAVGQGKTFVAIHDFSGNEKKDLNFKKGNRFSIIDSTNKDWWRAKCLRTQREGQIPSNYVEEEKPKTLSKDANKPLIPQPRNMPMEAVAPSSANNMAPGLRNQLTASLARALSRESKNPAAPPRPPKNKSLSRQSSEVRQQSEDSNLCETPKDMNSSLSAMNVQLSDSRWPGARNKKKTENSLLAGNLDNVGSSDSWYFGGITKEQCDLLLYKDENHNGTFLVRESTSCPGQFCLSILRETEEQRQVNHYRLQENRDGYYYIKDDVLFKSLNGLVRYYSALKDGLCCKLEKSCSKPKDEEKLWATSHDSIKCIKTLGKGNFGEVKKGILYGYKEVAVKMIKKDKLTSEEDFKKEAEIMKNLRHRNIVSLYGMVYDEPVWIITELMGNGSLSKFLENGKYHGLQDQKEMCFQVASGMAYLETKNCVHRDLRADNVLVGQDQIYKIADFGLARMLDGKCYEASNMKFLFRWSAPEAATRLHFSMKSDVWSYGVLLTEIFDRGRLPYDGMENKEVIQQVRGGYRMPKPENCPESIYRIMKQCWEEKTENRPSFKYLQDFFKKFQL